MIFFSETVWPIQANFYAEPPLVGETIVYITSPGHMTKMADRPILGKSFNFFVRFRTGSLIILKFGMDHSGLKVYKIIEIMTLA